MDVFYVYDFNKPVTDYRQMFLYNHNRHNEFNLNLGYIKLGVENNAYRANLAFHAGTYVNDNYKTTQGILKSVFESNIGVLLHKKGNLWLDAGIFASHIGFESAVSADNWNLTRSVLAENSPYYLTGAKLTANPGGNLEAAVLICNGWQRISRLPGSSLPSVGTQLKYHKSDKLVLNWSTFIGTDDPDSTRRMRYFNNLYGQFRMNDRIGLIIGFDIGMQQRFLRSSKYDIWYSPVIIGRFSLNKKWKTALRVEYYADKTGIMINTGIPNGFNTAGFSINVDYTPVDNVICRLEGRWLHSKDNIFQLNNTFGKNNFILGTSIAIQFSHLLNKSLPDEM
jgi:hypothetical protein